MLERDLRAALDRDVESEIDEARAEARDEAFKDVARNDPEALEEVEDWRAAFAETKKD